MSIKTKIQWCDSTCNPTMGCEGCELWSSQRRTCYAGMLHARFGGVTPGYAPKFEQVTPFPGRMAEAARWPDLSGQRRPDKPWLGLISRLIFVSDMSDALSSSVPFPYLEREVIDNVTGEPGRRHQWLWLSKRPDRMARFSAWLAGRGRPWPPNLWAGTSITTQGTTGRIRGLLQVGDERTVRFLSVEPQVEGIDIGPWLPDLDWVIQGGESGRNARPFDLAWARALLGQCREMGVPFFLKQLGSSVIDRGRRLTYQDNHAGDWSEWPRVLRVRQFPDPFKKGS
jgi:protein gp37